MTTGSKIKRLGIFRKIFKGLKIIRVNFQEKPTEGLKDKISSPKGF